MTAKGMALSEILEMHTKGQVVLTPAKLLHYEAIVPITANEITQLEASITDLKIHIDMKN